MIRITCLGAGVFGLLLSVSNPVWSATKIYTSAAGGSFSHDKSELTTATGTTLTSESDDSDAASISWGVASEVSRFAFEYYYQTAEISGFATDYTKQSLFYSGYWTPHLFVPKLYGILGAGIGISELDLDSDDPAIGDEFSDTETQFKISAGVEYRFTDSINVFGGFERHYTRTYSNWISAEQQLTFKEGDQGYLLLGIAARFN